MTLLELLNSNRYKHYDIVYDKQIVGMEYFYPKPRYLEMKVLGMQMHESTGLYQNPHYTIFIGE